MLPQKGWVAPFGDLGITGRSPLPRAFRSVPRPSSPLGAKASTRCPSRARPRPAPRPHCAAREQRSEVRDQTRPVCPLHPVFCPPEPMRQHRPYQGFPWRICIPMPGHDRSAAQDPRVEAASPVMPASRSRLASRCQNVSRPTPPCRARAPISSVRAAPGAAAPSPRSHPRLLVGLGRFERPTSRLSGVRSNQLSYRPGRRGQSSEPKEQTPPAAESVSGLRSVPLEGMRRRRPGSDGVPAGGPSLAAGSDGPACALPSELGSP
jgi:hypothetical protein